MRRIIVGIIGVTLLGLMACSDGSSSITAPSPQLAGVSSPAKPDDTCSQGNCVFTAVPYPGEPSQWHGETVPDAVPALGHPGHLTIRFPSFNWGATLTWDKFHHGAQAVCEITNDKDPSWKYVVPDHCGDGSGTLVVYPTETTVYTFTDKENPEQSKDAWQVATATVTISNVYGGLTGTWEPAPGFNLEDPVQIYNGTGSGPLNNLVATLAGPDHVHCGLGGGGEYVRLTAHMSLMDAGKATERFEGTYDGNPGCMAARGRFTLYREQ